MSTMTPDPTLAKLQAKLEELEQVVRHAGRPVLTPSAPQLTQRPASTESPPIRPTPEPSESLLARLARYFRVEGIRQ
jgi:hypothetical protein